jgi:hypothetical protein
VALKKVSTADWDRKSIDLVLEALKQNIRPSAASLTKLITYEQGEFIMNKIIIAILSFFLSASCFAATELVCIGQQASYGRTSIEVDCSNRFAVVESLKRAWLTLRQNNIGGTLEDMCWDAFNGAKDLHPSISFEGITDSFFVRCNMGLEYVE